MLGEGVGLSLRLSNSAGVCVGGTNKAAGEFPVPGDDEFACRLNDYLDTYWVH